MIPLDLRNQFSLDAYWICQNSIYRSDFYAPLMTKEASIHDDMKRRLRRVSMLLISVSERVELSL
jgi:hypothetical protein